LSLNSSTNSKQLVFPVAQTTKSKVVNVHVKRGLYFILLFGSRRPQGQINKVPRFFIC